MLSFIGDTSYIKSTISLRDSTILFLIISISVLISVLFLKLNHRRLAKYLLPRSFVAALTLILMTSILLDKDQRAVLSRATAYSLSPEYSLLWSKIFFPLASSSDESITLNLEARSSAINWGTSLKPDSSLKKNIILVVVEALRADIVGTGVMPYLDKLALDSQAYSKAYSLDPETSESILTVITGQHPLRGDNRDLRKNWDFEYVKIYDALAKVGMRTAYLSEEWEMDREVTSSPLLSLRFDPKNQETSSTPGLWNYDLAKADSLKIKALEEWINLKSEAPFFGLIYMAASHFPYIQVHGAPEPYQPTNVGTTVSFLGYPPEKKLLMWNRYRNTLRLIDSKINALISSLGQEIKNTTIIITGDHGEQFLEHGRVGHGRELDEEALKVPLIFFNAPPLFGVKSRVVSHLDLAPTILELANISLPCPAFQGQSLFDPKPVTTPLYLSVQAFSQELGIIDWPWKLVKNQRTEEVRLFNLNEDPVESSNVSLQNHLITTKLKNCLTLFQNQQVTFYSRNREYRREFLPPKLPECLNR